MGSMRAAAVEAQGGGSRPQRAGPGRLGGLEITFGIVLPLFCLLLDPCVFKVTDRPIIGLGPDPTFPHWRAAAWAFVLVQCGALITYALWRPRKQIWHALFGGLFLIGALSAFALAVVLAPLALIGTLFMGIGIFGLVPFFTSAVFLYRGLNAFGRGRVWRGKLAPLAVLVGMCVGLGVPVGLWGAGRMVTRRAYYAFESGTSREAERATARLTRWRFLIYPDDLVMRYQRTDDIEARSRLALAYEQLSGRDIGRRLEERDGRSD